MTVADFAVQAVVGRRLAERLPGATLVGEEWADALRLEEGLATLDQITHFVRSVDARRDAGGSLRSDRPRQQAATAGDVLDARPDRRHEGLFAARTVCGRAWQDRAGIGDRIGVLGCPELADGSRTGRAAPAR